MDEVDNIIIQTLHEIGCNVDNSITNLAKFSPELLIEMVAKCLMLINPSLSLPQKLPTNMAQRFSVATTLAEACKGVGFRGDIGYQTFLYSNVVEVRRVFMYLIERLPRENEKIVSSKPLNPIDEIEQDIIRNIKIQSNTAWIPQYCNKFGVRKFGDVITLQANGPEFQPCDLNIPFVGDARASEELRQYWLNRSPTVFQQTDCQTLCASIIHKNDKDVYLQKQSKNMVDNNYIIDRLQISAIEEISSKNVTSMFNLALNSESSEAIIDKPVVPNKPVILTKTTSTLNALNEDIIKLKHSIEQYIANYNQLTASIADVKELTSTERKGLSEIKTEHKIKERTHILLENPDVNITKMESMILVAREKFQKLTEQWENHKTPLLEQLERAKEKNSKKNSKTKHVVDEIKSTRAKYDDIMKDIKLKQKQHAKLTSEYEKNSRNISRKAYTSRIMEIIGNINKQKDIIDKVLLDTRDLQKEINNFSGQLDRQFTVTDDLIFKSAKKDEYSKKAYKLLATLHTDCNALVQLVEDTGSVMREVRELEDQIDNEKQRNVSMNLDQITNDFAEMQKEASEMERCLKRKS